jgi:hypothetical protein
MGGEVGKGGAARGGREGNVNLGAAGGGAVGGVLPVGPSWNRRRLGLRWTKEIGEDPAAPGGDTLTRGEGDEETGRRQKEAR